MSDAFDRRQFLSAGASALRMPLLGARVSASGIPPAPVAGGIEVVNDTYFGETLSDPYRRMANDKPYGKPIQLRVDYDAGHGIGSTRAQQGREAADTYAFLLWQLNA